MEQLILLSIHFPQNYIRKMSAKSFLNLDIAWFLGAFLGPLIISAILFFDFLPRYLFFITAFTYLVSIIIFYRICPKKKILEKYVTDDVIRSVALAHQTGRRLYIGTTDLDASRLVIWNMGVVAASDRPEAFDIFRKILLASASIPIIFPPVYIPVEVGGEFSDGCKSWRYHC